jgi:hypothetical protein
MLKTKEKFLATRKNEVTVLTFLLKIWSIVLKQHEFLSSICMTQKSRYLAKDQAILSSPAPKGRRTISPVSVGAVRGSRDAR